MGGAGLSGRAGCIGAWSPHTFQQSRAERRGAGFRHALEPSNNNREVTTLNLDGEGSTDLGWGAGGGGRGEIVLSADPARADYVQSPMHGVHTWPKVLVWTPETLRASQSERDTSVPCCLYLSEDSNALDSISTW